MVNKIREKKKFIINLLVFFLLLIILIISYKLWLPLPATFLLVRDNLQKADCIVPLRGDTYLRFKKAVELYNKGYAKNIVVSYLPKRENDLEEYYNFCYLIIGMKVLSSQEYVLSVFKYLGMGLENLCFTDSPATSTYEEAVAIREIMLKKGFRSMILVTSPYHTRRALTIFKLVFRNTDIKIYNYTARNEFYNPDHWWVRERDVRILISEYISMVHNFIYHFMLKKGNTSFDDF